MRVTIRVHDRPEDPFPPTIDRRPARARERSRSADEVNALREYLQRTFGEDAETLAVRLIRRFKTLAEVFAAPHSELARAGVPSVVLQDLAGMTQLWQELQWSMLHRRQHVGVWPHLLDYLRLTMRDLPDCYYRVLFLDAGGRLVWDEMVSKGTVAHVSIDPREIAGRCFSLRATGVITVRNNPCRRGWLSVADADAEKRLRTAFKPLEIRVECSLLVAGDEIYHCEFAPDGTRYNLVQVMTPTNHKRSSARRVSRPRQPPATPQKPKGQSKAPRRAVGR